MKGVHVLTTPRKKGNLAHIHILPPTPLAFVGLEISMYERNIRPPFWMSRKQKHEAIVYVTNRHDLEWR